MNRLKDAQSPYLLQHADNPVDWLPWGAEALDLAGEQDKPILLSIGYAACHWCHVMAHESFEDEATAQLMNDHFVNVKVDREERPDIDHIYQVAHQLMSRRSGGWPLTVFMTPEQVPFFIGTYFPPQPGRGMPSFPQILSAMNELWTNRRVEIERQNVSVVAALTSFSEEDPKPADVGRELLRAGAKAILQELDPVKGGTRGAPKFPQPAILDFCLSWGRKAGDEGLTAAALDTLRIIARGGMCDHIGGGFYRYCVDEDWEIPHFEKMLYDNALLLKLYSQAHIAAPDEEFRDRIEMTAAWALREMRGEEGGFFCSLDADSEGHEGKFYVWDAQEVSGILGEDDYRLAEDLFGLRRPPNFEGKHHLCMRRSPAEAAERVGIGQDELDGLMGRMRSGLRERRDARVWPGLDDKMLASWNALMASGLHWAGRALGRDDLLQAAREGFGFVMDKMMAGGKLRTARRNGTSYLDAYLNDYAFLLQAALDLAEGDGQAQDAADAARMLADVILGEFADGKRGGFYTTAKDHERLLLRVRSGMDDAIPSGNAVAASALLRLSRLTGEGKYRDASTKCIEAFSGHMRDFPLGTPAMLSAVMEHLDDG